MHAYAHMCVCLCVYIPAGPVTYMMDWVLKTNDFRVHALTDPGEAERPSRC